jgi:hypothetical protein
MKPTFQVCFKYVKPYHLTELLGDPYLTLSFPVPHPLSTLFFLLGAGSYWPDGYNCGACVRVAAKNWTSPL